MESKFIDNTVHNNLPAILKSITNDFDGRERDIVLLSSLGVLSSCLPNVYGLYAGKEVSANLYVIIIAPPASGKGVMTYSRMLVQPIHDKIYSESQQDHEDCNRKTKGKKNKDNTDCPPLQIKIIPANISSAEMYFYIGSSTHGVLIIESEADTMSNMLKNDWSNYSDVLRRAFHHEPISISRKMEKIYVEIKEPKLSLVMSGTPDQLQPLLKSKENGLFSRFIIYTFSEISDFKDVFASVLKDHKIAFDKASDDVFELYTILVNRMDRIEFRLTENQNKRFLKEFSDLHGIIKKHHPNSFLSSLNRHGLIMFRICMILTVLRNNIEDQKLLVCGNRDFLLALEIMKTILKHALDAHDNLEDGLLSKSDEDFLFALPETFTRKKAIDLGEEKFKIPLRTVDDKLVQWRKKKVIIRLNHGKYKRTLK